jgi:hypothetical protein
MFTRRAVPVSPEDQRLIEVARDLCRQLGYYNLNPDVISWKERMGIRTLPPDNFMLLRSEIQLSSKAMGRLSPEEWRPIFASGLTYYKNLQRNLLVAMLKTMLPITLLVPVVLLLSFRYLTSPFLVYPIVVALIVAIVLAGIRFIMTTRNLWFKADAEAARLVGKESMLESLRKIDQIDPSRTGKGRRGPNLPSPSDRIEKLTRIT